MAICQATFWWAGGSEAVPCSADRVLFHTPRALACRQAFGARDFKAVGVVLQRAVLVNLLFGGAIAVGWLRWGRRAGGGLEVRSKDSAAQHVAGPKGCDRASPTGQAAALPKLEACMLCLYAQPSWPFACLLRLLGCAGRGASCWRWVRRKACRQLQPVTWRWCRPPCPASAPLKPSSASSLCRCAVTVDDEEQRAFNLQAGRPLVAVGKGRDLHRRTTLAPLQAAKAKVYCCSAAKPPALTRFWLQGVVRPATVVTLVAAALAPLVRRSSRRQAHVAFRVPGCML